MPSASPLSFLRAGPPPPKVALLPDAMFFTRVVPVTPGATEAEAAAQAELALEAISPFPLAQLYYGWHRPAGAESALVFAAYRRRFTTEQTAAWEEAELVIPSFATALGAKIDEPATTLVLNAPDSVTTLHWETPAQPPRVLCRPLASEEERAGTRDDMLRALGGSRRVVELAGPPAADSATSDRETVFRSEDFISRFDTTRSAALDVRDKDELSSRRTAHRRDLFLWRVALGCVATFVLLAVGELALRGGRVWIGGLAARVREQKPAVEKIMNSQALANRIEELATKRLLPFEMLDVLFADKRKPPEIVFLRVVTLPQSGIHTLMIEALSTNTAQVPVYEATLRALPMIQSVENRDYKTRGETATFTLVVTFKPGAVSPAESLSQ